MEYFFLLILQILVIYFFSIYIQKKIFYLFYKSFKNSKISYYLISILYLPGTVFHELSHLFSALFLLTKINKIDLIPKIGNKEVTLGSVSIEKTDFLRGFVIGISPLLFGIGFFYYIFHFNFFPSNSLITNLLFCYLFFSISSSMFSSKEDLKDLYYFIGFILILGCIFYILNIDIRSIFKINTFTNFLIDINKYFLISIIINLFFYIIIKVNTIWKIKS